MKNIYLQNIRKHLVKLLLLLPLLLLMPKANASHLAGGDMSYTCVGPQQYSITFKVYRDCKGIPMCNCPGMAGCNLASNGTLTVTGVDPACAGSAMPGPPSMAIDVNSQVSGFDVIELCRTEKTLCTNCGTRSPGTYQVGIEVYTFTGILNLANITPSTCCNIVIGWSNCCRNDAITTLQAPSGLSYFVGATINRCATSPCSGAPTFTNAPVALCCAGQEYTYNLGAIDPEGDSLSYSFGSSEISANTPAPYKPPYNANNFPFPYLGSPKYFLPSPLGINIDPVTGDVHFTPTGNFVANFVIEVTQWRYNASGAPYKVGITRRDIQFYSKADCPPNNPPKVVTYNSAGALMTSTSSDQGISPTPNPLPVDYVPKTLWSVCAKNELCFIIEARDDSASTDTTDLTWNAPQTITNPANGTYSFTPYYTPRNLYPGSSDHIGVVKYDKWKFCWTPSIAAYTPTKRPYYFTIASRDRMCPVPARTFRSFGIIVNQTPDANITVDSFKCGTYRFKYALTAQTAGASLNHAYTKWYVETAPNSNTFVQKSSDVNWPGSVYTMTTSFSKGGKYRVRLSLSSLPPPVGGCPNDSIWFTVTVPDPVTVDPPVGAYNCFGEPVTVMSSGHYGLPGGNRFQYFQNIGGTFVSVRAYNRDSFATLTPPAVGIPPYNTQYKVTIIEPTQSCTYSALFNVLTRALPPRKLLPEIRICQSTTGNYDTTLWADGVNNPVSANVSYKWYKVMTGDTVKFTPSFVSSSVNSLAVSYRDSGQFVLIKTDGFGCKMWDSTKLDVNSFPIKGGSGQNACLGDPPLTMKAVVPAGASVTGIRWYNAKAPLITLSDKDTFQIPTNVLDSQRYVISSSTVFAGLGCPASDTITAVISPQPVLDPITPYTVCNNVPLVSFPTITSPNKTIKSVVWSYPASPFAINGKLFYVDSIAAPIRLPANGPYGDNVDLVAFDQHGCSVKGKLLIAVFPAPKVAVGPQKIICDYDKAFSLRSLSFKFNPTGLFPDIWSGRGVFKRGTQTLLDGTIDSFYFDPQSANVRKANPKDTNIISYKFTKVYNLATYPVVIPTGVGPSVNGPIGGCPCGDTIIFEVVKTPQVTVSPGAPICKSDPPFDLNDHFGSRTEALDPTTSKWYFAPPNGKFKAIISPDSFIFDPASPDINVGVGAQQTYRLIYRDISTGCMDTAGTNLIVNGPPLVTLTLNDPAQNIVCSTEGTVLLDLQPTPGVPGDIAILSGADINNPIPALSSSLIPNPANSSQYKFDLKDQEVKSATYQFTYKYINGLGCVNSANVNVEVQGPPTIDIFKDTSICSYDNVVVIHTENNSPLSPYGLTWNTNGSGVIKDDKAKTTTYTITPDDVTLGGVTFTVTSEISPPNECPIATANASVFINPKPKASFTCASCTGCVNPKYNLELNPFYQAGDPGVSAAQYFWYIDGKLDDSRNTSSDIFINDTLTQNFKTGGKHDVRLIVRSDKGCEDTTAFQTVEAYPTPVPAFEPFPRVRTIAQPYFNFNNTTSFGPQPAYLWSLGVDPKTKLPRTSVDISPQNVRFTADLGAIKITLRATSDRGCVDSTSDSVRINPDITVFVPTVFSPGSTLVDPNCAGDCNRSFKVVADGFESIEIFVFNRWGQKVFETTDVNNGWNGSVMNKPGDECPQDAYIYQVNATSFSGKTYQYSGSITLLR